MSQEIKGSFFAVRRMSWILSVVLIVINLGCASAQNENSKNLTKTEKARMLVEVANGALMDQDPIGALQHLARAEELDSSLPELHHSRALAYYVRHDIPAALKSVRRAVDLKPNYTEANNTLGKLLIDIGKYAEAEKHLRLAANDSLYREVYKTWTNLGILEYRRGNDFAADAHFLKAIQEAPNLSCIAYYYEGHIRLKNNQISEAIKDYMLATKKLCASFGEAHLALAVAFERDHQYDSARKKFLEVQKLYPNSKLAEKALDQLKYLP